MIDADRFWINDKAQATQAKKAGERNQEWRHPEKMDQAAHKCSGNSTDTERNPHRQKRVASNLQKLGDKYSNERDH